MFFEDRDFIEFYQFEHVQLRALKHWVLLGACLFPQCSTGIANASRRVLDACCVEQIVDERSRPILRFPPLRQEVTVGVLQPVLAASRHLAMVVENLRLAVRIIELVDEVGRIFELVEAVVQGSERLRLQI